MENQKHINSFKNNNKNSKIIIPLIRKNKSMNLIFEKKTNILSASDRNLIRIMSLNLMKKNFTEKVLKQRSFSTDKNFYQKNTSSFNLKKPNFLLSNYNSFHSHILHNKTKSLDTNEKNEQKLLNNKILFHNKILREAIFKKDGKFYSNKKINTVHFPKTEIIDNNHKLRFSQIKTRSLNFKLFKYKKIKIRDNASLNCIVIPKIDNYNIFNLK